jgi:ABC-type branched-subunit amino acid transport system ATPase component
MTVKHGKIIILTGSNSAGKTTLLSTLIGIVRAHQGRILCRRRRGGARPGAGPRLQFKRGVVIISTHE